MSKNQEYTPMTPAQRAALAEQREAQAQNRLRAAKKPAPPQSTPKKPTDPAQAKRTADRIGTNAYPKQPRTAQRSAPQTRPATPAAPQSKEDTNEFPTYVRTGKGGYRPPKPKKRLVAKQHRRPLDPRFKAALLAIGALALIFVILLCCGVRYTKTPLAGGAEIRFFGIVKDGVATNGWLSYTDGVRGSLKDGNSIHFADGSVYTGSIVDLKRSGLGVLTYANGDVFEGAFLEDKMNGQGILTYKSGDKYEGSFQNGKRSGQGVMTYKDGSTYEGAFANDRKNGQGTYKNGAHIFIGSYVDDIKQGYGEETFANGDTYKGNYENDKRNGQGVYTWSNGEIYSGNFKDNQMYGQCTFTWPSGRTTSGWYEDGRIVNQ